MFLIWTLQERGWKNAKNSGIDMDEIWMAEKITFTALRNINKVSK